MLKPIHVYPTMNSTKEVLILAETKLPINTRNEIYGLLMTYHNTLLNELSKQD